MLRPDRASEPVNKDNRPEVTLDDLENGYEIYQSRQGFRFGIDAVLLADFAAKSLRNATAADRIRIEGNTETGCNGTRRILDLGCGNGILPLLLAARGAGHTTGLEIQKEAVELAQRSVAYNHLEDRITIREGDIREAAVIFDAASFALVVSNPPYWLPTQGKVSPHPQVAIARHEICCTFADVAAAAAHVLMPGGSFCLVHRAPREKEILTTVQEHGLQPLRLRRVRPFADREPNLFLLEAIRTDAKTHKADGTGTNDPAAVTWIEEEPLTVYAAPGVYTAETLAAYAAERN